jgi:diphthine synthase
VGLGLTEQDITRAARAAIDEADEVVAEFYTSRLIGLEPKEVAQTLGRAVRFLSRKEVEEESEAILEAARQGNVCFLTGGDAMTATTHNDLRFRARKEGIDTRIVHGVSIQTAAAGEVGLHSYKFGRTTTLVMRQDDYLPTSPFEVILSNKRNGLHSLVLLDLDMESQRFMLVPDAARQILDVAAAWEGDQDVIGPDTLAVGCARIGAPDHAIQAAALQELAEADLGGPLHCLIVPGQMHFTEEEAVESWRTG